MLMLRLLILGLLVLSSCDTVGRPFDATVDDAGDASTDATAEG